jgi:hypothetical protein
LRAFRYDELDPSFRDSREGNVMGSSPHTDWGSFTVVWQDEIGGLQTYCRSCDAWVDVPASPQACDPNRKARSASGIDFVVHVGDMTSLAIRQAGLELLVGKDDVRPSAARVASCSSTKLKANAVTLPGAIFPSPLHRVLSPTSEKRVSLVYFAYPSPTATLHDLIQELKGWMLLPIPGRSKGARTWENTTKAINEGSPDDDIRFDEYYLLLDQDQIKRSEHESAADRFRELLHVPIRAALDEKWRQVQRPSTDNKTRAVRGGLNSVAQELQREG